MLKWFQRKPPAPSKPERLPVYFHNTLGNQLQEFKPPQYRSVRMYNCGPTVYDVQHVGNLSAFVFADVLRRTLEYNKIDVKQVINITDVGHLSSDADEGEDKMSKGLRREGLDLTLENMRVLAERYASIFMEDLRTLNIPVDKILFPRASDYVKAMIAMIQALDEKGYAYRLNDGIYFDVTAFNGYGRLGNIRLEKQLERHRAGAEEKLHPADFALWKFDEKVGWKTRWGQGFPGWHIECSAMIRILLGEQIDIHTGGIEHIAIHHNNEIAQSEAVTGKSPLSRFWLHRAHIQLEGAKISKSDGNTVYLSDVIEKGIHPLSFRYLLIGAHYRTPLNFTWESLQAAQTAFLKLRRIHDTVNGNAGGVAPPTYIRRFHERINDDLDTPGALAVMWEMVKDSTLAPSEIYAGLVDVDQVLGLGLNTEDGLARELYEKETGVRVELSDTPEKIQNLVLERERARTEKNWARADELRAYVEEAGYKLEDAANGPRIYKK